MAANSRYEQNNSQKTGSAGDVKGQILTAPNGPHCLLMMSVGFHWCDRQFDRKNSTTCCIILPVKFDGTTDGGSNGNVNRA